MEEQLDELWVRITVRAGVKDKEPDRRQWESLRV